MHTQNLNATWNLYWWHSVVRTKYKARQPEISPRSNSNCRQHYTRAHFPSPILSQVTWQVTWPRLRSHVNCGVFCLSFHKWLHKSLGPKSLGLFWTAPYCFPRDALSMSMHQRPLYCDVTECSTTATNDAYYAVGANILEDIIYQWRELWLSFVDML